MKSWRINSKTVGRISKEFRMKAKNLKLIARTKEDLRVVSAHLQDAIVNISDIANLEKNKIFLMQNLILNFKSKSRKHLIIDMNCKLIKV